MTRRNTKNRIVSVLWCVEHGPDRSHLWNVEWFARKRDAMARFQQLSPARVWRHAWRSWWDAGAVEVSPVAQRGCAA